MIYVIEELLKLIQLELYPSTVLAVTGCPFELKETPSVTVIGPKIKEHTSRRIQGRFHHRNLETMTYQGGKYPRLYYLDFELIVTCSSERELISLLEASSRFFGRFSEISIGELGPLPLTLLTPLSTVNPVNLSNLCQATGRFRVEDCPIFDGQIETGVLILEPVISVESGI